jgi:hypothetical protein
LHTIHKYYLQIFLVSKAGGFVVGFFLTSCILPLLLEVSGPKTIQLFFEGGTIKQSEGKLPPPSRALGPGQEPK